MMMASQQRAERTRKSLLQAAALEISEFGYDGSSLHRISKAAGVTMGALTFHFPTKRDLAHAIHTDGAALTREAVLRIAAPNGPDGAWGGPGPALPRIVRITLALGELLATQATVRASARLTRERVAGQEDWRDSWLPSVRRLIEQACGGNEFRTGVTSDTVATLTRHLVSGLEESALPGTGSAPVEALADVWDLVLSGLADCHAEFTSRA
ncbi:TetR family transcriptional regulator [Streptomyces misionensis]|uniref:TetR family transcriptional regulator n=1 Tax=Streptomyces misionensis TaxID=67331 RepID=A0A5C6J3B6_9ACTN|nr:TetR family transcriptional regulator [Streptomyces misionensis]TWV34937.1 TetR family transcriptional regulator [Streptomyces misionensis]